MTLMNITKLKALIACIRDSHSPVPVCDSDFKCPGWEAGMAQIEAAQIFCTNQSARPRYTAKTFKYCPWCGKEIPQTNKKLCFED